MNEDKAIFKTRREALKSLIKEDVIIIDSPENLFYYTGFTGGEAMFIILSSKQEMCIITDSRYYEQVEKECSDIPLVKFGNRTYIDVVKEILGESNGNNEIAIEPSMNLSRYIKLNKALDNYTLNVVEDKIDEPRMIKDDNEIELLRRAEHIGDEAFTHIISVIRPGMTEREIANELEYYMKKQGASKLSFDTIIASGPNSSMPHAQVTDRAVENGDFVTMDFGCVYKGYCSDMTRTVAVGNPSDEMKKVYQIVLDANLRAMEGIKEGVKCNAVDALARDYIKENGYGDYFGHGLGHSVGILIHEEPRFSPKCDVIAKKNMAITNEPGIYLPGKFGVRIEDLIIVKENGCDILSNSPKELIIL